jgi:hypothetical protein
MAPLDSRGAGVAEGSAEMPTIIVWPFGQGMDVFANLPFADETLFEYPRPGLSVIRQYMMLGE